jgi:integrase
MDNEECPWTAEWFTPGELIMARVARPTPPPKRRETPDSEVGGLYKITQPSGRESWSYRYRFHGRPRKLTIGDADKLSVRDARILAREAYLKVARDTDPGEEKKAARVAARTPEDLDLVERVVVEFTKRHLPHLAPSTQSAVTRILNKNVLPQWGGRRLSSIRKADVHVLLDKISDRNAPVMANRVFSWIVVLCNWAVGRGLIEVNPCNGISRPEPETPRERVLDNNELVALWRAAGGLTEPFGSYVRFLMVTGQRVRECGDLEWIEIDLDSRIWTLPGRRAKNGREHTVPLSGLATELLEPLPLPHRDSRFVFTLTGSNPIYGNHLSKRRLDDLLPKEMEPWTFHDIRRSVATGMAGLGISQQVVEKILNHVSGSFRGIVSVYQRHSYAEEKRHAMERWAQHLEDIVCEERDKVVPIRHDR